MKKIANYRIYQNQDLKQKETALFSVFYLMNGTAQFQMNQLTYQLHEGDGIAVNRNGEYQVQMKKGTLIQIAFDERQVEGLIKKQKYVQFHPECVNQQAYQKICVIIQKLIGSMFEDEYNELFQYQYSFELLTGLLTEFADNTYYDSSDNNRMNQIISFLHTNYDEELSLDRISDQFALTPQYFSRYFKEETGKTFLEYLNEIRLSHALEELLSTDHTTLSVAIRNGFPNIAAFNHVFKKKYNETPSEYRKSHSIVKETHELHMEQLQELLSVQPDEMDESHEKIQIEVNQTRYQLDTYWRTLLNVGTVSGLLNTEVMNQLQVLQKEIRFQYARIMISSTDVSHQFYEEDRALDYLYYIGLKPWFVIDYRTLDKNSEFDAYFREFMIHFSNKYGYPNVQSWMFEVAYDSDFTNEKAKEYASFVKRLRAIALQRNIVMKIAGPSLLLTEGGKNLRNFMKYNPDIDDVTIRCAPYTVSNSSGKVFINRITGSQFILDQYELACAVLQEYQYSKEPFIISWKNLYADHDILNDDIYRAAMFVSGILQGYGKVKTMALEAPLDLFCNDHMNRNMFDGSPGLITSRGIRKPVFNALRFLSHLDSQYIYHDAHMIVTGSSNHSFEIVIHNCKKLGYRYYLESESIQDPVHIPYWFEDLQDKKLKIVLDGLKDGIYFMKKREINAVDGNAFQYWLDMGYRDVSFIGKDEMNALYSASEAKMEGFDLTASDHKLEFDVTVPPNGVIHLHIINRFQ